MLKLKTLDAFYKIQDLRDTAKYLEYRVMHSMIDLTLLCLVGRDNTALDKQRKEGLDGLIEEVKGKVGTFNDDNIIAFLKEKGFSEQFARDELLPQVNTVISTLKASNDDQSRLIVDNWHLSKELHDLIEGGEGILHTSAISAKKINVFLQDLEKMILVLRQINLFLK